MAGRLPRAEHPRSISLHLPETRNIRVTNLGNVKGTEKASSGLSFHKAKQRLRRGGWCDRRADRISAPASAWFTPTPRRIHLRQCLWDPARRLAQGPSVLPTARLSVAQLFILRQCKRNATKHEPCPVSTLQYVRRARS